MTRLESREETVLRAALADLAEALSTPAPDALRIIRDRINSKTAARGATRAAARTAAPVQRSTAMTSIPRPARELRPGDIITSDPDHPDRRVQYRVVAWPKSLSEGVVLVDFTSTGVDPHTGRPTIVAGCGWWGEDVELQVVPSHVQGGAA